MKRVITYRSFTVFALAGLAILAFSAIVYAAHSNIRSEPANPNDHWAWGDLVGWIDFHGGGATVNVEPQGLTGYAVSSLGDISFDCATTRAGDICGAVDYHVSKDGADRFEGWAWNDAIGWVSFCGGQGTPTCPGDVSYRVSIDPATHDFQNFAWNDVVGWISMNCSDNGWCVPQTDTDYRVGTTWIPAAASGVLTSLTFDTGVLGGAKVNSILWRGKCENCGNPNGENVKFQIAAANCENGAADPPVCGSGTWDFVGPGGNPSLYFASREIRAINPTVNEYIAKIDFPLFNNQRYFRYKVILESNQGQTSSPRVDDIIVNWSP